MTIYKQLINVFKRDLVILQDIFACANSSEGLQQKMPVFSPFPDDRHVGTCPIISS